MARAERLPHNNQRKIRHHRHDEQQAVQPVEDAAVTWDEMAAVFGLGATLEQRHGQIAEGVCNGNQQAEQQAEPGTQPEQPTAQQRRGESVLTVPPTSPSQVFLGLRRGHHGRLPSALPMK